MFKFTKKMPEYKLLTLISTIIRSQSDERRKHATIQNGRLFCSDNKRALIVENFTEDLPFKVEDGFYIVAKLETDLLLLPIPPEQEWANPEGIIPKDAKIIRLRETTLKSSWIHSIFTDPEIKPLVDMGYLSDFYKVTALTPCNLHYTTEQFPIMLESQNMKYIVMPMSK